MPPRPRPRAPRALIAACAAALLAACAPQPPQVAPGEGLPEGVVLVDLDEAVRAAAPDGLPGAELFVDVCHMTRWGYGIVAETVWKELTSEGLVAASSRPSLDEVASHLEIGEPRPAP